MKSKLEIENRLAKLESRYRRLFQQKHFEKTPHNCIFNLEHTPKKLPYSSKIDENISRMSMPSRSSLLVVIQEDETTRICTYGSENPKEWNGNVCDDTSVSSTCPYFVNTNSIAEVNEKFDSLTKDDKLMIKNYPDMAALQWVLDTRYWTIKSGFFTAIFSYFFIKITKLVRFLKNVNRT